MTAIRTTGLSKTYDGPVGLPWRPAPPPVRALDDVSIDVREGEIFGFLGPNGSGKTTLIRLLLGYLHPTAGSAEVLGLDVIRDRVAVRRRVGYLPGGIALYDGMTGDGLLDYLAALYGRPAPRRAELCERLGLARRDLARPVRDFSRGMRQKLGIVQALQHDPELAILDEPSEGLDPLVQQAFYAILEGRRAEGRTTFLSSHVLSEVERTCDRVAIVRRGRLVAFEEISALLARRKRNVELRFDGSAPTLGGVPGVSGIVVEAGSGTDGKAGGGRLTCLLEGDVGPFLAALGGTAVRDLVVEPASLEEAFLEFYADELARNGGRTNPGDAGARP
jgi:ABC-2 type transport system ATP-binding protein